MFLLKDKMWVEGFMAKSEFISDSLVTGNTLLLQGQKNSCELYYIATAFTLS